MERTLSKVDQEEESRSRLDQHQRRLINPSEPFDSLELPSSEQEPILPPSDLLELEPPPKPIPPPSVPLQVTNDPSRTSKSTSRAFDLPPSPSDSREPRSFDKDPTSLLLDSRELQARTVTSSSIRLVTNKSDGSSTSRARNDRRLSRGRRRRVL